MENFYYGRFAFVLLFLLLFNLVVKASEVEATMSLQELFNPYADMENGITGTVNSGGKIEVKVFDKSTNTLVYHTYITSSSTSFAGTEINYNRSSLGSGAIYYPNIWKSKDIKTALVSIDKDMMLLLSNHIICLLIILT